MTLHDTLPTKKEIGISVIVAPKGGDRAVITDYLDELEFLAETAGVEITTRLIQERDRADLSTVIGKGKVQELKNLLEVENATVVIFDDDLSPAQVRNLERELEVKILDRSGIILDIFAKRARSIEAKTQVELAQLQYMYPRLTRMWTHLSKQYGGVGTKGPGETQIETDRRMIRLRIQRLKQKLIEISQQREIQGKLRSSEMRFALVGYTNAGKSTLMNIITDANVYAKDQLFATLDTTIRQFTLPSGQTALLSDTVGFIRKLPTHVIASFRTTLAESIDSDVLIHVVDCSHPTFRDQYFVVTKTLEELNIETKDCIVVMNKIDAVEPSVLEEIRNEFPQAIYISATRGIHVRQLLSLMQEYYDKQGVIYTFDFPYSAMKFVSDVYAVGEVLERQELDTGVTITVKVTDSKKHVLLSTLSAYIRPENVLT